jgi:hypothetical protein
MEGNSTMAMTLDRNGLVYDESGKRLTSQEIKDRQKASKEEDPGSATRPG